MGKKLKWGIIGTAGIAKYSVIPGIKASETGEVIAIASRSEETARKAAAELDIAKAYGSYEELLSDSEIEAVYIPLPNHLHKEWTIRAAEAGKHVLCEKPIALNAAEAEEMVLACQKAGVQLAEAFMYRHHPRYQRVKEILASGEIGAIRGIHATFTFSNPNDKDNVRFKKGMGGGSLYDVGCYPLSAARFLLEEEPEAATIHAFFSEEHDHVDMMASGLVEFSNSVALTFDCGMWASFRNEIEILGSDGRIEIPAAFVGGKETNGNFIVHSKDGQRQEEIVALNQYSIQADNFAKAIFDNQPLSFAPSDAIQNMKLLDACLESAHARTRVTL